MKRKTAILITVAATVATFGTLKALVPHHNSYSSCCHQREMCHGNEKEHKHNAHHVRMENAHKE